MYIQVSAALQVSVLYWSSPNVVFTMLHHLPGLRIVCIIHLVFSMYYTSVHLVSIIHLYTTYTSVYICILCICITDLFKCVAPSRRALQVGISAAHWAPLLPRERVRPFQRTLRLRNVVMEINKSLRYVMRKSWVKILFSEETEAHL